MSILFAASELDAFGLSSTTNITGVTTSGEFDSEFARGAMKVDNSGLATINFTGQTEGWLRLTAFVTTPNGATGAIFELQDSSGVQTLVQLDSDGAGGMNLEYWNGATLAEISPAFIMGGANSSAGSGSQAGLNWGPQNSLVVINVHWNIADAGGLYEIYLGDILVASFTGDTLHGGFTQIDRLVLGNGLAAGRPWTYSEIIVADEDTRDMRVATNHATADGNDTAWTNGFANIDEVALNDVDLVSSGTAAQVQNYVSQNLPTNDMDQVPAVIVCARAQDDTVSPDKVDMHVRVNATNYFGATQTLTASFDGYFEAWNTSPDTASAWTRAEVDALEFGQRSSA